MYHIAANANNIFKSTPLKKIEVCIITLIDDAQIYTIVSLFFSRSVRKKSYVGSSAKKLQKLDKSKKVHVRENERKKIESEKNEVFLHLKPT